MSKIAAGPCGQGKHLVAMRCKASWCLRCTQVAVEHWGSQVSRGVHEGVLYGPLA
jgi:hypothetical protein